MKQGLKVGGLLGVVACALLTACSSKADRIESGLRKGNDYVHQDDWDKANVEARNVLQMDPKNARAYLIAAQVEDGKANYRNAYGHYSKAVELKPDLIEARLGLARIYLLANETAKAEETITEVLASDPGNLRGRTLQAALLARQGRVPEALALADKLVADTPAVPADSSLVLAGLYVNANDHAKALSVLDKALAADARNVRLLQMAAEVAGARKSDDAYAKRADGYYKAATIEAPKHNDLWRGWTLMHIRRNEIDRAESVLREAIRVAPDDSSRTIAMLDFVAAFRGGDAAEKEFKADIEAHPKDTALRFALADFYRGANRPADAMRVLQDIADLGKDTPAALKARGQLASLWLQGGQVERARTALAEVLKINPRDATGLVLRGRLSLGEGRPRDAIIDLRSAARDLPGNVDIANLLARAHHAAGEPQLAREVLADAVKFRVEDAQLHLLLAADMAAASDYKAAVPEVDEAIRLAPQNLRAYEMRGELALKQGDAAALEKNAREIESRFPKSSIAAMQRGRLFAAQKRFDEALKQYDAAAVLAPASPDAVITAVGVLVAQRKYKDAELRIDALAVANPKSPLPHQLRGEMALSKGDLALAERSFKAVLTASPGTPVAYKNLAAVMVAKTDLSGALTILDEGEKAYPEDSMLPSARAEWLGRAGRADDAIRVYEDLIKRSPGSDEAANNLAYLLTEAKGDKVSLDRAMQLAIRFELSNDPSQMDTLGMVRYRLGLYDQATLVLERAVALSPGDPLLQLHYGMALYKKGDLVRGKEFLRKAFDSKASLPNLAEARSLVAQG